MAKKKRTRPTKSEVAQMVVLDELGESYRSIGRMLNRSNHTVKKYLNSEAYLNDPAVQELITVLRAKEIDDLTLLVGKARARLHELLDEGKTKVIETTAIMDRAFQQIRLLQGQSTQNINAYQVVNKIDEQIKEIDERIKQLRNEGDGQG